MITLINEAAELQQFFESENRDFFFVGGIALQIWGQPRLTTDIDCTIFTNLTDEDQQIWQLLRTFKSRFSDPKDAFDHARTQRVLLLENQLGTGIDVLLSGLADINEDLARSSYQVFTATVSLKICSAESLIAFKTFAGRLQDYAYIETVIIKQNDLDWEYIYRWLAQAAEYQDISENLAFLQRLKAEYYRQ